MEGFSKNGMIEEGVTPPEKPLPPGVKQGELQLESHLARRLADGVRVNRTPPIHPGPEVRK